MPKGKKVGGRDWKPGQSGNPAGPKPLPEDVKQARRFTRAEFERVANELVHMTKAELKERLERQGSKAPTTMELMVGMVIVKAIQGGDDRRLNFVLEQMLGKLPSKAEIDINARPSAVMIKYPDGREEILGIEDKTEGEE